MQGRYLSGLAAGLSLAWNLGSLVVLAWPDLPAPGQAVVVAMSFSVLSLLPAVLLHVSLQGDVAGAGGRRLRVERRGGHHAFLGNRAATVRLCIRPRSW